jgi:ketosteroid isomerase-like protein
MSVVSANVDLVREGLAAWRRGDVEEALTMAHPEIVSVRAAPLPDPQTYHGHEGILEMYADWTTDFSEFEMYPDEIEEVGDRVLVLMIQRGVGKASGVEVVGRFWFLYTFSEGLAVRQEAYATREQALRAAG